MCGGCSNVFKEEKYRELDSFIETLEEKKGSLITVLHKAQSIFGYLPYEVQSYVGEKLNIPSSKVNGVVTFYSYFTEQPKGEHVIQVCLGTACFVRGSDAVLKMLEEKLDTKAGKTTKDGKFSLDPLRCIGACGLAPVLTIDGKVYGQVTPNQIDSILAEYK
ncbi:MAG: NAD(P)H-dependent oxidoreductase subunit E [Syntrophomonadaceae bacterium]|jgi:NADH-quinone oxidoreductase subunit E